jgi:hypothetical protein
VGVVGNFPSRMLFKRWQTLITMRAYLYVLMTFWLVSPSDTMAQDADYLEYSIPASAKKVGPSPTKNLGEKDVNYLDANSPKGPTLVGHDVFLNGVLIQRDLYLGNWGRHGMQKEWYPNGVLKSEIPYRRSQIHGVCRYWDDHGQLVGQYEMNEGSGQQRIYDSAGRLVRDAGFVHGKQQELEYFMESGSSIWGFVWLEADRTVGNSFSFFSNGDLRSISCRGATGTVLLNFLKNGEVEMAEWFIHGRESDEDSYRQAAKTDPGLPVYEADARKYKNLLTPEIRDLKKTYQTMPLVKIPLEFGRDGKPILRPR